MEIKYLVRESKQSGFSLVELMVVIGVLAILSAFAIPGFMSWRENFELKGAARDLLGHMQKAKLTAVKERENVTMEFNSGANSYIAYIEGDGTAGYAPNSDDVLLVSVTWSDSVYYDVSQDTDGISFPDNTTEFRPNGLPSPVNGSGSVFIKNDNGKQLEVVLSSAGNIRIDEY